jgi:hypothetical protein
MKAAERKKMRGTKLIMVFICALSCGGTSFCQQVSGPTKNKTALSPVRLLPGYIFEISPGFEGNAGGSIWHDGGLKIQYILGLYTADPADSVKPDDVSWKMEQVINNRQMRCIYTKSHELFVSFPRSPAYFRAKIRNERQLTDMLLMVVTLDTEHGYSIGPPSSITEPSNSN